MIVTDDICGVVLCGGRGSRMGGVDKGLQLHAGRPLAQHALQRLGPQVASTMIVANRHLDVYQSLGVPVYADTVPGFAGPLAGFLSTLSRCDRPYLATVPCDSPGFPLDLVARLAAALQHAQADIAVAATPGPGSSVQRQPVFCLMSTALRPELDRFVRSGQRQVGQWLASQRCIDAVFDDAEPFFNVNTLDDLRLLGARPSA